MEAANGGIGAISGRVSESGGKLEKNEGLDDAEAYKRTGRKDGEMEGRCIRSR